MLIKRAGFIGLAATMLAVPGSASGAVNTIPGPDIVIDIGHGGIDGGTSFGKILEKDINLAVGLKLYPVLREKGIVSSINRTRDYALSDDNRSRLASRHKKDLIQRTEIANRLKPAFMISLHVNWADNRAKTGALVIYRKNHEPSKRLAAQLQSELNSLYHVETAPEPAKKYYILNHTQVPAVIIEMGYLSNSQDRAKLISGEFQHKLAEAIGKASEEALRQQFKHRTAYLSQ